MASNLRGLIALFNKLLQWQICHFDFGLTFKAFFEDQYLKVIVLVMRTFSVVNDYLSFAEKSIDQLKYPKTCSYKIR